MIAFLFSPIGRWIAGGAAILLILGGIYVKIRLDAERAIEARGTKDALTRTQDAVRAGDSVDTSPDGLRSDDGYRRK
jgi:hypothetical protein